MNRGSARRTVFPTDRERRIFLELAGDLDRRFGTEIHAYCLMNNHDHLLVRSAGGRLSESMQRLGAQFTRTVNHVAATDGPIFRGRFTSVRVEQHPHLLELVRYIHRNPLAAGWDGRLAEYEWSSHGAYLQTGPAPHWLHQRVVWEWFAGDAASYRDIVEHDQRCQTPRRGV
jgi:putative transposase